MKEVRLTIDIAPDGTMSIDADGFEGDSCLSAIEDLLGELSDPAQVVRKQQSGGPTARRKLPIARQERS